MYVLVSIFKEKKEYKRYGSNCHVFIEASQSAFSPDASIVKGTPDIYEYARGKTANKNPWLVVEVLSKSTRNRGFGEKLTEYKKCPGLQYIIYAEQDSCLVTVFNRMGNTNRWQSTDYNALDQSFTLENHEVVLADLYDNIEFNAEEK